MFNLAKTAFSKHGTTSTVSALRLNLSRNASSVPVTGANEALKEWTSNKKLQEWVSTHGACFSFSSVLLLSHGWHPSHLSVSCCTAAAVLAPYLHFSSTFFFFFFNLFPRSHSPPHFSTPLPPSHDSQAHASRPCPLC